MITVLLHVLLAVAALYCAVVCLYLFVVTVAAYGLVSRHAPPEELPSCAVIIPAHNEASQIIRTLEYLARSDYPPDRFRAYVIADNCDDETAVLAASAGATVLERNDPENRGKGQALDWCFRNNTALLREHAVTAIIDADSMVEPEFLRAVAARLLAPGVSAVQASNSVANPLANWRTALTAVSFALVNRVRPAGLERMGACPGLKGNGMAFRSEVLAHRGWPAHSIVEDVEFGVRLLLEGHRTAFAPEARITSDMPVGRKQADAQRRRWEFGRLQVATHYLPALVRAMLADRMSRYLGAFMEFVTPPLSLLAMLLAAALALSLFAHPLWTAVFAACAMLALLHVVLGAHYCRMPGRVWLAMAAAPLFLLWKLRVYAGLMASRGQRGWVRTPRDGEPGTAVHPPQGNRHA